MLRRERTTEKKTVEFATRPGGLRQLVAAGASAGLLLLVTGCTEDAKPIDEVCEQVGQQDRLAERCDVYERAVRVDEDIRSLMFQYELLLSFKQTPEDSSYESNYEASDPIIPEVELLAALDDGTENPSAELTLNTPYGNFTLSAYVTAGPDRDGATGHQGYKSLHKDYRLELPDGRTILLASEDNGDGGAGLLGKYETTIAFGARSAAITTGYEKMWSEDDLAVLDSEVAVAEGLLQEAENIFAVVDAQVAADLGY